MCSTADRRWWQLKGVPAEAVAECPDSGDAAWQWLWRTAPKSMELLVAVAWLELNGVCPDALFVPKRSAGGEPARRPFPPSAPVIDLTQPGNFAAVCAALACRRSLRVTRELLAKINEGVRREETLARAAELQQEPPPEPEPPAA